MTRSYAEFLEGRRHYDHGDGFKVDESDINPALFDFQRAIVAWACEKGRAAVFADCGLGKTPIQLEWARLVCERHGGIVLIVAPLAVAEQTAREGEKFGVPVNICRTGDDVTLGVNITNYEMLGHFSPDALAGIVLEESSVLKSYMGVTKRDLVDRFGSVPYKLCCTATPSPNDHMELLNHAEFLGIMRSSEALSIWFINDTSTTGTYRLKKHAEADFWRWCSSWAVSLNKPSDISYEDDGFVLPPLTVERHIVETDPTAEAGEQLFRSPDLSATGFHKEKRLSADARAAKVAELVAAAEGQVAVWCETNYEADAVKALVPDAVEVRGSDSTEHKVAAAIGFAEGAIRCLLSKPSIFGFGLNFQGCHEVVFCGLSYSFESYYQAVRRFWRFGQTDAVHVHVVIGDGEVAVLESVLGKEAEHEVMKASMSAAMHTDLDSRGGHHFTMDGTVYSDSGPHWTLYRGDAVEVIKEVEDDSVGLSVFSPPFSGLYIYSDNLRDMGNTASDAEFFDHFSYLLPELYRVTMPGRLAAVHCKQLVNYKGRDGAAGLRDFRGDIIRAMQAAGFVYHSEVTIWTDPVHEMQRTKSHGLLYKQLRKDSTYSRQGLPEYLCVFRKWGEDVAPVEHTHESFPLDQWQEWASPVWMDVRRTDVLNAKVARDDRDEKHICLARGSLVLTCDGYVPIETVTIGTEVLTHEGRWRPVLAAQCNGVRSVMRTCAQGVADLRTTPEHCLWMRKGVGPDAKAQAVASTPDWVEAQDALGSYVNLKLPPVEDSALSPQECWIIGRWLGDGHRTGNRHSGKRNGTGQFLLSCSHHEAPDLLRRLADHAGHIHNPGTATQIALRNLSPALRSALDACGHGASGKRIPRELMALDKRRAEAVLSGYLSADGHYVPRYNRWMASSVSRALLLGMAMIAQRARGVVASVYAGRPARTCSIQGRTVRTRQDWVLCFRNSQGYRQSGWIGDDGAWKKVRRSESAGECEVWDLQVADDASFVAEGATVKNCPLQLSVIERAVRLWTNPGDLVFSPFAGIGSEGYEAVRLGRRFVGIELKESYWRTACKNLAEAEASLDHQSLFAGV